MLNIGSVVASAAPPSSAMRQLLAYFSIPVTDHLGPRRCTASGAEGANSIISAKINQLT